MNAQEIIEEALKSNMEWEAYDRLSWLEKLFTFQPKSRNSSTIWYLTNRLMSEMEKANKAEQKMYEGIRECIRFIEQREPETAIRIGQKYL